jgi:hypothetical protein
MRILPALLVVSLTAVFAGCVVAPARPVYVAPAGVVYVAPGYVSPGPGHVWAYHASYGWGWHHPQYGWHRGWQ